MKLLTIREAEKLFLATVGLQWPTILPSILTRLNPKEPSLETTWLKVLKIVLTPGDFNIYHAPGLFLWQKHLCASYEEVECSPAAALLFWLLLLPFCFPWSFVCLIFITMEYITSKAFLMSLIHILLFRKPHTLWPF